MQEPDSTLSVGQQRLEKAIESEIEAGFLGDVTSFSCEFRVFCSLSVAVFYMSNAYRVVSHRRCELWKALVPINSESSV